MAQRQIPSPARPSTPGEATVELATCPFCTIAAAHPPYDPLRPPCPSRSSTPSTTSSSSSNDLSPGKTSPPSFVVLSTDAVVAFLDIMPLSPGHLLLCPRTHRPKLTATTPSESASLGYHARILSAALERATGVHDWNVVQNNGAAAAQVVPHVHYHIIPRPEIRASGRFSESFTMFGRGMREELIEEEGVRLADRIRGEVKAVLEEEGRYDVKL